MIEFGKFWKEICGWSGGAVRWGAVRMLMRKREFGVEIEGRLSVACHRSLQQMQMQKQEEQ
jgi:hypothetical protein